MSDNYYLLLELPYDPPEQDQARIDAVIRAKQAEWTKLRIHPSKGPLAKKYLSQLNDIKKSMADPEFRKATAKAAKILKLKEQSEKFKKLDAKIAILSAKGKIFDAVFKKLVKQFPTLTEAEIKIRIKVPIVADEKEDMSGPSAKPLDSTNAKRIAATLSLVKKTSLYDFLELTPKSSIKTLQQTAKEKEAALRKYATKNDPITAGLALAGECHIQFKSEDNRQRYDATLTQEKLSGLDELIEIAGETGCVEPAAFDALIKKASEVGLNKSEARRRILGISREKGWAVQVPEKSSATEMVHCGICGILNRPGDNNCFRCGNPLELDCPQCGKKQPSNQQACSKCGFFLGDVPNALILLKKAKLSMTHGALPEAALLLAQAQGFWPGHQEIEQTLKTVTETRKSVDDAVDAIFQKINQRNYYAARKSLQNLRRLAPNDPNLSQEAGIDARIRAAEAHLAKARAVSDDNDRIKQYTAAIAEARDCQAAVDGMAKLPPKQVAHLKIAIHTTTVSLSWPASPSQGELSYKVVRKIGAPPANAEDGDEIVLTEQLKTNDTRPIIGSDCYYGIFTLRGQASSRQGALAGPVMITAAVANLQIIAADQCATLTWTPPSQATEIEVWRKNGPTPPNQSGDGHKLPAVRRDGVTDTGLKNDQLYSYRICAIFTDGKGVKQCSPPLTCQTRPLTPPKPVKNLTLKIIDNKLRMNWTPPKTGTVLFFSTGTESAHQCGDQLTADQVHKLGTGITVQQSGSCTTNITFQWLITVVPVTVQGEAAVVGLAATITSVNDIDGLTGQVAYDNIILEWQWPSGTKKVVVIYRQDTYATSATENGGIRTVVSMREYAQHNGFVIHKPRDGDYYFTVFVMAEGDKGTIYSSGRQCHLLKGVVQEISYRIEIEKSLFGKIKSGRLVLHAEKNNCNLPPVVLVQKAARLPLEKSDGIAVLTLHGQRLQQPQQIEHLSSKALKKNHFLRLFFEDDSHYESYRLLGPSKENLRIN